MICLLQDFLRSMAGAIKASNSLPSDRKEDWDYYTTFKSFRDVAHAQQETIEKQISAVLKYNGIKGRVDGNDVARTLEILADANDQILERVGTYIDEASGVRKKIDPLLMEVSQKSGIISGSWNKRPGRFDLTMATDYCIPKSQRMSMLSGITATLIQKLNLE